MSYLLEFWLVLFVEVMSEELEMLRDRAKSNRLFKNRGQGSEVSLKLFTSTMKSQKKDEEIKNLIHK
jgi:hypothetical protein